MRFRKIAEGWYEVLVDGKVVGEVRRRRQSYGGIRNSRGRRMGTYTYWDAYRDGERVVRSARTRQDAAALL